MSTTFTGSEVLWPTILIAAAVACNVSGPMAKPERLRIEVHKSLRQLSLFAGDRLIKTYHVGLGTNPVPPKERRNDRATPEGSYYICAKNPKSRFHLSLAISYPGPRDAERGLRSGLVSKAQYEAIVEADRKRETPPWGTELGGEVFVHGSGAQSDWTWGCVALEDPDIEELYNAVPIGTPITIFQ